MQEQKKKTDKSRKTLPFITIPNRVTFKNKTNGGCEERYYMVVQ